MVERRTPRASSANGLFRNSQGEREVRHHIRKWLQSGMKVRLRLTMGMERERERERERESE